MPSWGLSIVLAGLQRGPFEPLDSVKLKFLSAKTALLTALTSIKKVGDLQAFSASKGCLVFGPVYSHVVLRPRPGYVPKVPTTPFCDQVVNLQALSSEEADPALALLCPVRALGIYVEELAGVTLAVPFPLTRGYERFFLLQFSSPDGEPWWNPPSTPGSQTGRSKFFSIMFSIKL